MGYVHVFKTKINSELNEYLENEDVEKQRPIKRISPLRRFTPASCIIHHVSYIMYHTVHVWLDAGVNLLCTPRVAKKKSHS